MRSLPNILKYFMKPHAEDYQLPDTEQMADTLEEMVRLKESVPYEGEPPSQSAEQDEATHAATWNRRKCRKACHRCAPCPLPVREADACCGRAYAADVINRGGKAGSRD